MMNLSHQINSHKVQLAPDKVVTNEGMAEGAILAALKVLGNALAGELVKLAVSKVSLFSELQNSMNRLSSELRVIKAYLDEMETDDGTSNSMEAWTQEVQKFTFQIEDIVAEFTYLVGNKKFSGISFYCKTMIQKPKALVALERIAVELSNAEKNCKHLAEIKVQWVPPTNARIGKNPNHLYSANDAHFIDEDQVVGIQNNRGTVTNWLNSNNPKLSVISVWGMGGVGKTTLVTNIFKKEKINFDCHAWITISQSYTCENLLRNLISEICKNGQRNVSDITNMDLRRLKETLRDLLEGKKYFIVLDDIWDPKAYLELSNTFIDNQRGSRIVITSRVGNVANLAPENNRLELKPLAKSESWDLFCSKAFQCENQECPPHLEQWASGIVSKCGGLPLALVSIGSTLNLLEKNEPEWKLFHDQLRSELDKNPSLEPLKSILNLSFKYLPRYLKNCFLYCGLFPEDSLLVRKKLIRLWIAEGLIEKRERSTLEVVAESYLKDLIHRSLLQVVEKNESGRVRRCRMHDTLRELAITLCQNENFGVVTEGHSPICTDMYVRRLSIVKQSEEIARDISLSHMRTFMYFNPIVTSSPSLSLIFDKSRYLTVLDLEGLPIDIVPDSVGDLFNLHYLGLRKTKVKCLPNSIKKLHNLQTLDLYMSKIQKLPKGIIELKKLRHLFAEVEVDPTDMSFQSYTGINLLKSVFYLKELQTIQAVESNDMVVKELCNLTQLTSFRIRNVKENQSAELCRSLSKINSFSSLSINASNENEILHLEDLRLQQIQKLCLRARLKENMLESLLFQISGEGIQSIWLMWSQLKNDPMPFLSHCKNLTYLYLQRAYEGQQLTFRAGWFPKLKILYLKQMPNLVQVEMEQGTLISLDDIRLLQLNQLVDIPKGIEHIVSLKWMGCVDMPALFGGLAKGRHKVFHFTCGVF